MVLLAFWALLPALAMAEQRQIAFLGDSLVAGYGLPQEDGLVPALQSWLTAQGSDALLLNAGVSGDTTSGGLARLSWTLSPEVDGLIVSLGANDMLRGLPPEKAKENLFEIVTRAQSAGVAVMLIGFQAPGNWGPDYKAAFDGMYPDLARDHDLIFMPSFFGALSVDGTAASALSHLQADGLHPNRKGVARLSQEIGPFVLDLLAEIEAR